MMNVVSNESFLEFSNRIKDENLSILCYGAGLVALSIQDIFAQAGLLKHIKCFIDKDEKKHGTTILLCLQDFTIYGIEYLLGMDLSKSVLLITAEVYGAIIEYLNQYPQLNNIKCYIYPLLNASYLQNRKKASVPLTGLAKIPKMIHYCWLGGGEMPADMLANIKSWEKNNPDYEIIQWNEESYDVYQNSYMAQSYDGKKFAFTADYIRLDILYRYGGIYLDTDVMCLKSFDSLLGNDAFCVYLEWAVPTFGICGSIPGLPIIKQLRDEPRATQNFILADGSYDQRISSYYETKVLKQYGFQQDFSYQNMAGLAVYPPEYFVTVSKLRANSEVTDQTYAIHLLQGTWIDHQRKQELEETMKYAGTNNTKPIVL